MGSHLNGGVLAPQAARRQSDPASGAAGTRGVDPRTPVAIVGGGIMGVSIGYELAKRGIAADIYEASPTLGGLAGPMTLGDGTVVDRFYHAILTSDAHLLGVCRDLGLEGQLRFKETGTSIYIKGGLHSMSSVGELLRFPPLRPFDRFRLGAMIGLARLYRDWKRLDEVSVERWLVRLGGRSLFEALWRPMLAAKYDGDSSAVAATWMWARLVRMGSTRGGASQREQAGHLVGGYPTLLEAMASRIRAAGGRINLGCPVRRLRVEGQRVVGIEVDGAVIPANQAVLTMQGPVATRLLPDAASGLKARLEGLRYLGIVCPLFVLDRPLTGTWTVNVADQSSPFTGVIETTTYIDPSHVGGHHLVYVPKYTQPGSSWQSMTDGEVVETWTANLERMFPAFSRTHIREVQVHRERYVDPLHPVGHTISDVPVVTDVGGLFCATTAQIYPALTSGESVTRYAAEAASAIADSLGGQHGTR